MITPEHLAEMKGLLGHFDERRRRAAARLELHPAGRWYFGVIGLSLPADEISVGGWAKFLRVSEPAGAVELSVALAEKTQMTAIARYSVGVRAELVLSTEVSEGIKDPFNFAWWVVSALRARSRVDVLIPIVADCSWSAIAAAPAGSCRAQLLEDVPRARRLSPVSTLDERDVKWVADYLLPFVRLLEVARFRLAIDCLTTHTHEASIRMTAASLWVGIEALFDIAAELRFRLASLSASFLEAPGLARIARYRAVKRLYDMRSKVVHGAAVSEAEIVQHSELARDLLSALVCKMTELGRVPTGDDWDQFLFG